ncbi:MAG: GMC family oxidoreductase N-terminal domain-containing protein, partial [Actinomycetota bacterium]
MVSVPDRCDAVVIGAGPAGATVARRLAGDGRRVVVLDAGPGGPRPAALAGLDVVAASARTERHWPDLAVRDRPDGPLRPYRQGSGLGGGSMINGMLLSPGDRADYERWVGEWGCVGWGPNDLAPWLERTRADQPTVQIAPGPVS